VPGVFKNAIDWMSRPASDIARVFGGKPVTLIGASPGNFGTILSQNGWLPTLRTLGAELWTGGRLMVSGAGKAFDDQGDLIDEAVREKLARFMAGFVTSL
jgi:NAD(P)H-dependent FMN reductase